MAVPFAMPEDDMNDLIRVVMLILSRARLDRAENNHELIECMEKLMMLLMEQLERRSRSQNHDDQLRQALLLVRQCLEAFAAAAAPPTTPRRRTSSESSCCDGKLGGEADLAQDCKQEGARGADCGEMAARAAGEEGEERSLWRLVTGPVRSLWTAVPIICVVGWHLLQTSCDCI